MKSPPGSRTPKTPPLTPCASEGRNGGVFFSGSGSQPDFSCLTEHPHSPRPFPGGKGSEEATAEGAINTMIAANYRKHPDAAALQLPLPFPHRLVWALPRPGARILRAIRVARGKAFAAAGRIAYPIKLATPQWWKDAKRKARDLANQVRDACMVLIAEVRVAVTTADTALIGFSYEREIEQAAKHGNRYRVNVLKRQQAQISRHFPDGCPRCDHQWVRPIRAPVGLSQWLECTNCHAAWEQGADLAQIRRELTDPDY